MTSHNFGHFSTPSPIVTHIITEGLVLLSHNPWSPHSFYQILIMHDYLLARFAGHHDCDARMWKFVWQFLLSGEEMEQKSLWCIFWQDLALKHFLFWTDFTVRELFYKYSLVFLFETYFKMSFILCFLVFSSASAALIPSEIICVS